MKKRGALTIALLFSLLGFTNFFFFTQPLESVQREQVTIARVIDGDTFVTTKNTTNRLANINTFEHGNPLEKLATDYLKGLEGKSIEIEIISKEKYGRDLVRVYSPDYENLRMIEKGLANVFLVNKNEKKMFSKAEKEAIENERGVWKKSNYSACFNIKIDARNEIVNLESKCGKINLKDWRLKDESRLIYTFPNIAAERIRIHSSIGKDNKTDLFWNQKNNVWNDPGDSLYLFDKDWKLVHYQHYGD